MLTIKKGIERELMQEVEEQTIWKKPINLAMLNGADTKSMPHHVGIEIVEVGPDFIKGSMPVDHRTKQPFGILHGGASVVLAETLGSIGGNFCLSEGDGYCVGLDINSNHIRSATEGKVIGTAKPFHLGRTTHVWHIEIHNEAGKLINISRLTLAIIKK